MSQCHTPSLLCAPTPRITAPPVPTCTQQRADPLAFSLHANPPSPIVWHSPEDDQSILIEMSSSELFTTQKEYFYMVSPQTVFMYSVFFVHFFLHRYIDKTNNYHQSSLHDGIILKSDIIVSQFIKKCTLFLRPPKNLSGFWSLCALPQTRASTF